MDGGSTWVQLASASGGASTGRIALALGFIPDLYNDSLYEAVSSPITGGLYYLGRSDNPSDATPTFTNLTAGTPDFLGGENPKPAGSQMSGQGWYDIAVAADAQGNVFCAGVEDYLQGAVGTQYIEYSWDQGADWLDISKLAGVEPHTDAHALSLDSADGLLIGTDGGIWYNDASGSSWANLNGNLNTIQFYEIGLHPTSTTTVVGGSQDNGTDLYNNNTVWSQTQGGDGGFAQFSQTKPSRCYAAHPNVEALFQSSDSGCATGSWVTETSGFVNTNSNFTAPFVVDRTIGDHLLIGFDRVYETTDAAAHWIPISTPQSNGFNSSGKNVDSVALSPANGTNPQVVYASTGGSFVNLSQIFVTTNDGNSWAERDLPACTGGSHYSLGCRVNQIVVDANDPTGMTAVAVTNNFTGRSGGHVYRTTNGGTSWTDIGSGLPDLPTWSVQVDNDEYHTLYISNDTGVYSSPSPYTAWSPFGTGLPNAQGRDLELNSVLRVLAVATHGRGVWEMQLP